MKKMKCTISKDRVDDLAKEAIERMAVDYAERFDFKDKYSANYVYYKAIREERLKIASAVFSHEDNVKAVADRMKQLRDEGYKTVGLDVFLKPDSFSLPNNEGKL